MHLKSKMIKFLEYFHGNFEQFVTIGNIVIATNVFTVHRYK